ncbi:MAG TPA: S9 family peptidase [Vicinamibacteria bacterium]|nr:S9 family peptidase [Vicinamibacteria bacterium]
MVIPALAFALLALHVPTIDELIELEFPGEVAISPDGALVAYTVTETNWEADRYEREIWLARRDQPPFQLTRAERSSFSPSFSPDGKWIGFLSDRTEKRQLYRIPVAGGEAEQLTVREDGVEDFEWAHDGAWMAVTAADPKSDAMKEREKRFGDFSWEDEDHRMTRLYKLDLGSRVLEGLTEGEAVTVDSIAISPDGRFVAFSARPSPDVAAYLLSDLYVTDVESRRTRLIVGWPGADGSPRWSPDGTRIAFVTSGGVETYYGNDEIAVVSPSGGDPAIITGSFDEDPRLLTWRRDGIYFLASARTERHLYRLSEDGSDVTRLSGDAWVFGSVSLASDAPELAFTADRFERFTEVYRSKLDSIAPAPVTDFDAQLADLALGHREVISWESTDGTTIEGVLVKPADFDSNRKYPLLFKIHGGPTGVDSQQKLPGSDRRYYPIERFVAKGSLVLMVNYRGSAGYGAAFRALNVRNLGIGDAWDVESALDRLIDQGIVDPERVGTMGWSQGGYISAFLTTHSSARFRAASVGAGISDWMTYYVNTDIHPFTRQYLKDDPWDDPAIYEKTSPITYIKRARTPTLIQHGENDARVPIPNAYELYQGLRDQNVPVRLAVYKGFGHGIDKPKSNRAVMTHNEEWFSKWIWEETAESSSPDQGNEEWSGDGRRIN